jgi:Histone chaperone involved in gene silencing
LSVSYKEQEFFRVGYYVYNTYTEQELIDNPPEEVQIDKVVRNILAEKPRITRFDIKWGDEKEDEILASTEAQSIDLNANENSNHAQMFFNGDPNNLQENQKGNPFLMTEEKQIDNFQQNVFGSNDNVKDNIGIHVEDPSKFRGFF